MADLNIADASKAGLEDINARAGTILHLWQENTRRMMRANECALHGMISAVRVEMALGQELAARRVEAINFITEGGKPTDKLQLQMERSFQDLGRVMETMREASNELREGFTGAAKILFEKADEQAEEIAGEVKDTMTAMQNATRNTTQAATEWSEKED